ncbi:MAG: N-6 DNA methylase [Candidatus Promineifilaceae bacterium]
MNNITIRIEGGLLSPDFLETIHEAPGQKPQDFGLKPRDSLVDEISAIWGDIRAYWEAFQRRASRAQTGRGESPTTITREQWMMPLLETLGYTLSFQRRAVEVDGRSYAISHRADSEEGLPVHIVAYNQDLGDRPPSGRGQLSPHALLQDYLNRTDDHLWGIVTNGRILRLLRDSTYFTRPAYIEFDLEAMLTGERLDEFFLLYRLAHRTRLPRPAENPTDCLLEQYYQQTLEQGGRIRDGLRQAVADALITFANGFLRHPRNTTLRTRIYRGELTADGFYQQLLYLIYRLLFLMVAESRNLLELDADPDTARASTSFYRQYVSVTRLRMLGDTSLSAPERFDDLYLGLRTLFHAFHDEKLATMLGVPPLNGELFSADRAPDLDAAYLNNRDLLHAIRLLSYFTPPDEKVRRRVNYAALDVEELGSVYESLLDEQPVLHGVQGSNDKKQSGNQPPTASRPPLTFSFVHGMARKTSGSYYTPRELVNELLNSALVPVIEDRLANSQSSQEAALLSLRVCDPACGSGHFLLAAARRIGYELAKVRAGADEPSPRQIREATRDAITHCIYGVDKNPLAVDLCKVALWIEGYSRGKPLTFLDYRIRCGDSLVGVLDLEVLAEGIPDEAYKPVSGDDKKVAAALRQQNKQERAGQAGLLANLGETITPPDAAAWDALAAMPEDTPAQINAKRAAYERLRGEEERLRTAVNLWMAAFFAPLTPENRENVPTSDSLRRWRQGLGVRAELVAAANALAAENRFFHWPLEFPQVFAPDSGAHGFDVVLGNPPWERIKLQEKEFFASRDPKIANARNAAVRRKLIAQLPQAKPALYWAFMAAKRSAEAASLFVRDSGRYPLCGRGDVNTYAVFAELARDLQRDTGRAGIIVPSGIATDDTTKFYFRDIMDKGALVSLYDFENRQKIFPAVDSRMKFCLLTLTGAGGRAGGAEFVFFAQDVADLRDEERRFTLSAADIALLNPNTRTCPIFRSKRDAELTKAIYGRVPVLMKEGAGDGEENPWGINFFTMFHMSNDSGLFRTRAQLEKEGGRLDGNRFVRGGQVYLPLYEAKMLHQFDHRWATYEGLDTRDATPEEKDDPAFTVLPRYWVAEEEVGGRLARRSGWLLGFRDIARSTDERTAIFSVLPETAVGHKAPLIFIGADFEYLSYCFTANAISFAFDYVTRQSVGGTSLSYFILKQLPVLPPQTYRQPSPWQPIPNRQSSISNPQSLAAWLLPRVLELTYTAYDLRPFAQECGYHGPPFRWDEERRFLLRCELDAAYFHLYGIARDDVAYIMDTFPIVRRKDEDAYGEYRTRRVILEIYDEMGAAIQSGRPYQTRLNPPPAHPAAAHPWDEAHLGPELPRAQWWQPVAGQDDIVKAVSPASKEPPPTLELKPPTLQKSRKAAAKPALSTGQPPLVTDFTPPQGSYPLRLKRVMALGQPKNQAELAELVAALGDESENIRWLAGSALSRLGSMAAVRLLAAYLQTNPGELGRAAALKALALIAETTEDEAVRAAAEEIHR